jgi:hypothetical protein
MGTYVPMKLTTRGPLAALMACMATAVTATPAVAGTSVPVTPPLESLETVVPLEAPAPCVGAPVPVPGAPDAPRHITGLLLSEGAVPAVPFTSEPPQTLLELLVEKPLGEGNLGVARAASEALTCGLGQPEPTLPEAALRTPGLQGDPAADLLLADARSRGSAVLARAASSVSEGESRTVGHPDEELFRLRVVVNTEARIRRTGGGTA